MRFLQILIGLMAFHKSSDVVGKVKYPMLADDQFKLSKQFKVLRSGEGRSDRGTFIVDPIV